MNLTRVSGYCWLMATFRIVSADAHVLEPPHIWKTWLPTQYQDKAPTLVKDVSPRKWASPLSVVRV